MSDRKRTILKAVVIEYVTTAEPIASERLTARGDLGVKSATVRNELAELAELGYLDQPHTSSGRIPSDRGYRYYVDFVASPAKGVSFFRPKQGDVRDVAYEATKALSRMTRLMAAAVTLKDAQVTVRHSLFTALGPNKGLLILILSNGHSENRLVQWNVNASLQDIADTNLSLHSQVTGKTLGDLARLRIPTQEDLSPSLLTLCLAESRAAAKALVKGHVILEGEEYVLSQPEFAREPDTIGELADALSDEASIKSGISPHHGRLATATIGTENTAPEHQRLTILRKPFHVGGDEAGVLAIIGPTRMDYDRNLAILDWSALSISHLLTSLHS